MNNPALALHAPLAEQRSRWRRYAGLGFAVFINAAFVWAIANGLAVKLGIYTPPVLETKVINTPQAQPKQEVPPPQPQIQKALPMEQVPTPVIQVAPEQQPAQTIHVQPQQQQTTPPVSATASALPNTHTTPPYPPTARRLGQQGTVILSITVGADGSVTTAAVATSSGFPELDQAALEWVKSHWRYKPALQSGVPVPSQTKAAVKFDLTKAT